jgi:hypothetical protein
VTIHTALPEAAGFGETAPDTIFYSGAGYRYRASWRDRSTSLGLAIAIIALVLYLLIRAGALPFVTEKKEPPLTFQMLPSPVVANEQGHVIQKTQKQKAASGAPPAAHAPPTPKTPPPPAQPLPPNMIVLNDSLSSTDIGKIASAAPESGAGTTTGKDSSSDYGPGAGPGGARLYNAEWYQRPTDAQMAFYMPKNGQSGTADIACKTIERYHVENCQILGESPPGTGLARAVREAAWQFLILPPRQGGKALIGSWVRIHYTFTVHRVKDDSDRPPVPDNAP